MKKQESPGFSRGEEVNPDTAQTAKTGPRTREQASSAYEDAEASECCAGSYTAPHGATEILRLITHGRCECDLCTNQPAETDRSQP